MTASPQTRGVFARERDVRLGAADSWPAGPEAMAAYSAGGCAPSQCVPSPPLCAAAFGCRQCRTRAHTPVRSDKGAASPS
ncbi:hypothetical protein MRX96_034444 [Rhipicephalus microplus]